MPANSLIGCVSKALLFIVPRFASNHEMLECVRYTLYEHGFVIVCEEHRLINIETARKVCEGVISSSLMTEHDDKSLGEEIRVEEMSPFLLVGQCYVFVLARANCSDELVKLVQRINNMTYSNTCGGSVSSNNNAAIKGNVVVDVDEKYNTDIEDSIRHIQLLAECERDEIAHKKSLGTTNDTADKLAIDANSMIVWTTSSIMNARRSISLLFPHLLSEDIPTSVQSREYVQAHLKQALLPALTELCKTKPQDPIRWLAEKLLNTNTQAPTMIRH